jgi:serine/threonine protein kinase
VSDVSGLKIESPDIMTFAIRPEAPVYKLKKLLGEGLSSRVFAAIREDSRGFSRQEVVLKILKNETDVSWMKREFAVLSRLRTPHCARIYGWENLPDEGPALVLEYIDGVTLLELARATLLSSDEIDEITSQIQGGLRAIRELGLYHGDLSPTNIMIDRRGIVRLIDFAVTQGANGCVTATPPYISPEVWDGGATTASSDLFSLGLIRLDLRDGLQNVPQGLDECRMRAQIWADSGCSLLVRNSSLRKPLDIVSRSSRRTSLATRVNALLRERAAAKIETAELRTASQDQQGHSRRSQSLAWRLSGSLRHVRNLVPAVLGAFPRRTRDLTVVASLFLTPTIGGTRATSLALLEIRSQRWIEVELDGKRLGFSPLTISGLAPGSHHIRWRMRTRQGESSLTLKPAEVRLLTENDLIQMAGARGKY